VPKHNRLRTQCVLNLPQFRLCSFLFHLRCINRKLLLGHRVLLHGGLLLSLLQLFLKLVDAGIPRVHRRHLRLQVPKHNRLRTQRVLNLPQFRLCSFLFRLRCINRMLLLGHFRIICLFLVQELSLQVTPLCQCLVCNRFFGIVLCLKFVHCRQLQLQTLLLAHKFALFAHEFVLQGLFIVIHHLALEAGDVRFECINFGSRLCVNKLKRPDRFLHVVGLCGQLRGIVGPCFFQLFFQMSIIIAQSLHFVLRGGCPFAALCQLLFQQGNFLHRSVETVLQVFEKSLSGLLHRFFFQAHVVDLCLFHL